MRLWASGRLIGVRSARNREAESNLRPVASVRKVRNGHDYFPWRIPSLRINTGAMTRSSIEFAAKVYIVALIVVFIWTVTEVLAQIGLM